MDRTGTIAVPDAPNQRARLGGTTLPGERSVWDDSGSVDEDRTPSNVTDHDARGSGSAPELPQRAAAAVGAVSVPVVPVVPPPVAPLDPPAADDQPDVDAEVLRGPASVFDVPADPPIRPTEPSPGRSAPIPPIATPRVAEPASTVATTASRQARRRIGRRHLLAAALAVGTVLAAGWWLAGRPATTGVPADPVTTEADVLVEAPPITVPVAEGELASDEPAGDAGRAEASTGREPAGAPAVVEPTEADVVIDAAPVAGEPPADAPAAPAPDRDEPPTEQPAIEQPAIEPPATEQPATEQPSILEPSIVEPSVEEPSPEQPVAEAPTDPRRVELSTRNEPCRFGSDCLVVGFSLVEFGTHSGAFVCEFASGARYEFRFEASTVATACMTGGSGDTITVEVDGVRSETAVNG